MKIGVLGAGQLGRMLALEGYPLGLHFVVLTPKPEASATPMCEVIHGTFNNPDALDSLAARADVVTYESENIPVEAGEHLSGKVALRPGIEALRTSQDRLFEKNLFQSLGIGTAPFRPVDAPEDLAQAVAELGLPAILKTRRMGYDGKGQRLLKTPADTADAFESLGGVPCILEGFCTFRRELSIVGVRGLDGHTRFYPLVENEHQDGVLRKTWAPAPDVDLALQQHAEVLALKIMERLDYVGVVAVELFQDDSGLRANEMAPRTHNSGHWTLDGAVTSQFESHARAISGLPLGDTAPIRPSCMINFLGTVPDVASILEIPGAHLHLYDKSPRPGRKLGHVTVVAEDDTTLRERVDRVEALIKG